MTNNTNPAPLNHSPRPQRSFDILDQLAVQLLPPQPGAAIIRRHRGQKSDRQMQIIIQRPPCGDRHPISVHQRPHQRHRSRRRRRHQPRSETDAQSHFQIVPGRFRLPRIVSPLGNLVAPAMAMLWPAQSLRFGGRIEMRLRAILPGQPLQRRFPDRPPFRRRDRQQTALSLDHHRAGFGIIGPDQRKARAAVTFGNAAHPLRPGPGLAKAAPGHDQPDRPVAVRRHLTGPRPEIPAIQKILLLFFAQGGKKRVTLPRGPLGKKLRLGKVIHHCRSSAAVPSLRRAHDA